MKIPSTNPAPTVRQATTIIQSYAGRPPTPCTYNPATTFTITRHCRIALTTHC